MRFGMILEVSLRILRRHWAVLLGLAVLFVGPGALLTAATGQRFTAVASDIFPAIDQGVIDTGIVLTESEVERLVGALLTYIAATMLAGLLASLGALGFSAVVGADYHHRPMAFREALLTSLRRAPSAIVFVLITTVVIIAIAIGGIVLIGLASSLFGGGALDRGGPGVFLSLIIIVALVVAVAYLTMRWAPAFPVMANEGAGWRTAMARSCHRAGGRRGRIPGTRPRGGRVDRPGPWERIDRLAGPSADGGALLRSADTPRSAGRADADALGAEEQLHPGFEWGRLDTPVVLASEGDDGLR
jgi:hypothetical protein